MEEINFKNNEEKLEFKKLLKTLDASPIERILYYFLNPYYFFKELWNSISSFSWKL